MELDALGLISACSYALDCVEAELVHVTSEHAKRVAYMSVCVAEQMGIQGKELQDLAVCALLHDNALTQYIIDGFEELRDWAAFHHERLDGTGYPFGKTAVAFRAKCKIFSRHLQKPILKTEKGRFKGL